MPRLRASGLLRLDLAVVLAVVLAVALGLAAAGCGGSTQPVSLRSISATVDCGPTEVEGRTLAILEHGLSGCPEAIAVLGGLVNFDDPAPPGLQCDRTLPGCWSAAAKRPRDAARFVVAVP